jgi:hypothetical protein
MVPVLFSMMSFKVASPLGIAMGTAASARIGSGNLQIASLSVWASLVEFQRRSRRSRSYRYTDTRTSAPSFSKIDRDSGSPHELAYA